MCGISLSATMRQGVDQPCRIRGSWGCGPAPGGGTGGWRRKTLEGGLARGLPHDAAAVSALAWVIVKPAPEAGDGGGGGGGGGGLHRVGWGGSAGGWLADRWKANGELGWPARQARLARRGLDEVVPPPPLCWGKGIQSPLSTAGGA